MSTPKKRIEKQAKRAKKLKAARAKQAKTPRRAKGAMTTVTIPRSGSMGLLMAVVCHMRLLCDVASAPEENGDAAKPDPELGFQYINLQVVLRQLVPGAGQALFDDEMDHGADADAAHKTVSEMPAMVEAMSLCDDFPPAILPSVNAMMGSEGVKTEKGWAWKVPKEDDVTPR